MRINMYEQTYEELTNNANIVRQTYLNYLHKKGYLDIDQFLKLSAQTAVVYAKKAVFGQTVDKLLEKFGKTPDPIQPRIVEFADDLRAEIK